MTGNMFAEWYRLSRCFRDLDTFDDGPEFAADAHFKRKFFRFLRTYSDHRLVKKEKMRRVKLYYEEQLMRNVIGAWKTLNKRLVHLSKGYR